MKHDKWTAYDSIPMREYVEKTEEARSAAFGWARAAALDELLALAFNAGYDVATARAESRRRMDLPIEREEA